MGAFLVLRLLGPLAVRQRALAEMKEIPGDDPDGAELISLLNYVRCTIAKDARQRSHRRRLITTPPCHGHPFL